MPRGPRLVRIASATALAASMFISRTSFFLALSLWRCGGATGRGQRSAAAAAKQRRRQAGGARGTAAGARQQQSEQPWGDAGGAWAATGPLKASPRGSRSAFQPLLAHLYVSPLGRATAVAMLPPAACRTPPRASQALLVARWSLGELLSC